MEQNDFMRLCIGLYSELAQYAVPCAVAFGVCNMIVNTFLSAAFGGRMRIGGDK